MSKNAIIKRYNLLMTDVEATYHEAAWRLGLSDSAMLILYTICHNGEKCLLNDITSSSGISKQTINSALRKLEAEDIIYLESTGGRKKMVCLTAKGKEYAQNTVQKILEIENDIFASWKETERIAYLELTEKYLTTLKSKVKEL